MVIRPSAIMSSKRRGELTEMMVVTPGSSRIWSSVRPRAIAIIAMPSSALPRPIAETWKLLSVSVRLAK